MNEQMSRQLGEEILKALAVLAESLANPKPVTPTLVKAWTLALGSAGVRPEEIEPAVGLALQTATFFPTPADFLKLLRPPESTEATEELAWQSVLTAVREWGGYASLCRADFGGDGGTLWALSRMGWPRLCAELTEEHRAIWRAEFVRLYRAGRQTHASAEYLAGVLERENGLRGYSLNPGLCGRPDWPELPASRGATQALPEGHAQIAEWQAAVGRPMPEEEQAG